MSWTPSEAERVKAIEVKQESIEEKVNAMDGKLDELLELKNKGMGAFWLISILMGAAFTVITTFIGDLFK